MFLVKRLFPCIVMCVLLILSISIVYVIPGMTQEKYPDPSRSIDLIIPFAPGGAADVAGRIFADEISKILGVPVVPVNKAGASGTYGATLVSKAKADGYTLLTNTTSGMILAPVLLPKIEYDTKDFFPIAITSFMADCIIVRPDSPYQSINTLIEAARKNPGKVSYGTAGVGSDGHFNGEILASVTNVKFKHVPFKGGGEIAPAVMGGHVDFGSGMVMVYIPLAKANKLKILAITGNERMKSIADVPTFQGLGIKGNFIDTWTGFFAPATTPAHILDKLVAATEKVLKSEKYIEKIEKIGVVVRYNTPSEFKSILERDKKTAEELAKKMEKTKSEK